MQNLRVTQTANFSGASVIGIADKMMPKGQAQGSRHIFVDGTYGNDGFDGKSWESAYATFEKGIDACRFTAGTTDVAETTDNRAFLFMASGHYSETTEMLWSGHQISVIGCGGGRAGGDKGVVFNYACDSASTGVFLMSGSGNELFNFFIKNDAAIPSLFMYGGDNNWVHNLGIEGDGSTATVGICAYSMKGCLIEDCDIASHITYGIHLSQAGTADEYAIMGAIRNNRISMVTGASSATGILVDVNFTPYSFAIDRNFVECRTGSSSKGIDVNCIVGCLITDNYVSVPSSATPIEHAGGEQYILGNHTAAGTTNVDPNPAAG